MSGNIKDKNGNATFTLSAGDNDGITAQLSRLVARVSISSIKTDFDPKGQYSAATYELKNIFVRNAIKEVIPGTGEYSTTKMGTPAYLSGNYDKSSGTADYLANAISPAADVKTEHQPTTGFMFSQTRKPPIRHWYWKVHSRKTQTIREVPSITR